MNRSLLIGLIFGLMFGLSVKISGAGDFQSAPPRLMEGQLALVAKACGHNVRVLPMGSQWALSGPGVNGSIASGGPGVLWIRVNGKNGAITSDNGGYRISFTP